MAESKGIIIERCDPSESECFYCDDRAEFVIEINGRRVHLCPDCTLGEVVEAYNQTVRKLFRLANGVRKALAEVTEKD